MSLTLLIISFAVSLVFVMGAIIRFKMHPFLALILGSLIMGLIAGLPLPTIASSMASGFGNTLGSIGIVITLGIILGQLLYESGATEQIAGSMLRLTGEKNAVLAVNITGLIVSIPVFFDAAFVILINLIKQLSKKGKVPFISLVSALAIGLITTHCLVIPTPGPLAVASGIGVNIGWMVLYGLIVSVIASFVAGVLYARSLGRKPEYANDFAENAVSDEKPAGKDGAKPTGGLGIFLIFLPIFIILLGTILTTILPKDSVAFNLFKFLGDKNIALLIGCIVAFLCLKKYISRKFEDIITTCGEQAGAIFIITGAGGAFAAVINATGIGDALVQGMSGWTSVNAGIVLILVGFAIAQILRAMTGAATVALITTAGIMGPIVASMSSISPVLVALAICAGGIGVSIPNDSGFWVVNRFSNFSIKQTFQAWTIGGTISGVVALICILLLSLGTSFLPGLL